MLTFLVDCDIGFVCAILSWFIFIHCLKYPDQKKIFFNILNNLYIWILDVGIIKTDFGLFVGIMKVGS